MPNSTHIGLEQARSELPRLVSEAAAGATAVITRHGRPCAALVPLAQLQTQLQKRARRGVLLALRGTGSGLLGPDPARTVAELRHEWD